MAAITITDLNNAKLDVDHIAEVATSTGDTSTDRLGGVKPTLHRTLQNVQGFIDGEVAILGGAVWVDEPTGRAAVSDGESFKVQGAGEVAAYEYRRVGAGVTSTLIASYPSSDAIDNKLESNYLSLDDTLLWAVIDSEKRILASIDSSGSFSTKYNGSEESMMSVCEGDIYIITDYAGRGVFRIGKDGTVYGKTTYSSTVDGVAGEVEDARGARGTLDDRLSQSITDYGMPKVHRWGEQYLRETKQRLRKRMLGESVQLVVASIGDSWTHNTSRWSGPTSDTLKTAYGNAGPGWTGFAWGFGGASNVWSGGNGCADSGVAVSLSSNWLVHYSTSASPDLCDIYSSTAASKVTVTYSGAGDTSSVWLHYIAGAGSIRYRWNAGSWTTLDTSVGSGRTDTALVGMPTGTWTLEIENVSGTTTLCGVDIQKTGDGVRWHKLGATGSRSSQWVSVNASQWQAGITSLAPNLVIILHGTNDQSTYDAAAYSTYMQTLISRIRTATPLADILLVAPCENGRGLPDLMSGYAESLYQLAAANKCGFIDLQSLFGESFADYASTSPRAWFNVDGVHPEPLTGGRVIVDAVVKFVTS